MADWATYDNPSSFLDGLGFKAEVVRRTFVTGDQFETSITDNEGRLVATATCFVEDDGFSTGEVKMKLTNIKPGR